MRAHCSSDMSAHRAGDDMRARRSGDDFSARSSRGAGAAWPARAFIILTCALALLASSSSMLRAQSGRRSTPEPAEQGKKGAHQQQGNPTPTPTPMRRIEGPIAGPVSAADSSLKESKQDKGVRPPSVAGPGARASSDDVGDDEVVRISSSLVPLPASVVDAQGRAVADLKVEDFELKVDGEVKPIGDLSRAETPVSIALLFDNSSSLNAMRDFERKAGIRFLQSVMRPVDRAAIYSISTEPQLAYPMTSDVHALVRTIENFGKAEGATALFDTVAAAAEYLKPQRTRKVILIVSDGTDTISDLDFDTTMARLLADDCQVYAVQTGNSDSPNLHDLAGERRLQEFSAQTGGAVYVPHTNTELADAFRQIATDLSQQYVLSYYPSGDLRDGRFRAFTLQVKTRPNLRVRTRKGYYAPKG
ncbi:MAG: Ca-activated chloride channel [Acidobacteriota bacterium]|nr:Ca-activated chloride channel [Acidobacteriota bacterium]